MIKEKQEGTAFTLSGNICIIQNLTDMTKHK